MPTKATAGPKPDFQVVENHLYCQTDEGEISIDLRIPFTKLELFMDMEEIPQQKMPRHLLDHILHAEDKSKIEGMRDGAKAFGILMYATQAIGERLGVSLGEFNRSTESSESTDQPSDTTSDTDSASPSTT